jgi:uncharacterized UBP type Zn finger protein
MATCEHVSLLPPQEPPAVTPQGCQECLFEGTRWVHLRLCLSCGHVGCCDSSPQRHASKHFADSDHPIIRSYQPGEDWRWCFADELII